MTAKHAPIDDPAKQKILTRLRTAQGHLASVVDMVASDAYCIDVLQQTSAVRSALAKIEGLLLQRHLEHCASSAMRSDDPAERENAVRELLEAFGRRA